MTDFAFPNRAQLELRQLALLRELLRQIVPHNPFQAAKLSTVGELASLDDFYARVPSTIKQELVDDQAARPPYGTNLTFPIEEYTRFSQTSGTTGSPLRWLDTPASWSWMVDNWAHVMGIAGVTPRDRVFCAFSFGPFIGLWLAFEAATRLGCLTIPGGGMSSMARVRAILDNEVTVLCCTPTYAIHLAEIAAAAGLDFALSRVRVIVAAGEPGASIPATRARIERLWPGARVSDHHGMTEIGPVSFPCPERDGVLHIMEHAYIAEVIDASTGGHASPGAQGELVLTNLGRTGSPLVRYRTGDLVRTATAVPCACGRYDVALEGGILGRVDDMVIVRGVNIFPSAIDAVVRRFDPIAEYRVEVDARAALAEISLIIEPRPDCSDTTSLVRSVQEQLRAAFDLRIPVSCAETGTLPRFELKARRWVRRA